MWLEVYACIKECLARRCILWKRNRYYTTSLTEVEDLKLYHSGLKELIQYQNFLHDFHWVIYVLQKCTDVQIGTANDAQISSFQPLKLDILVLLLGPMLTSCRKLKQITTDYLTQFSKYLIVMIYKSFKIIKVNLYSQQ